MRQTKKLEIFRRENKEMKKVSLILAMAMAMLLVFSVTAFAAQNIDNTTKLTLETPKVTGGVYGGSTNYPNGIYLTGTNFGDYPNAPGLNPTPGASNDNIHSDYNRNTDACAACHATHTAVGAALLQWDNIQATCYACHDGTIIETYNVQGGYIAGTSIATSNRTMGGLFGTVDANSLSKHNTEIMKVAAAPGGKFDATTGNWTNNFECTSCHEPHGSGDNYRILSPDPNQFKLEAAKAQAGYPKVDKTLLTYAQLTADGTVAGRYYSLKSWIAGYPYSQFIYVRKVTPGITPTYTYLNEGDYTIDYKNGAITLNPSVTLSAGETIQATFIEALRVDGTVNNKLKAFGATVETASYGKNMNKFCGTCHTDYSTQDVYKPSANLNGTYTSAYRHKVGVAYNGASKHKDLTFGTGSEFTCLTCHVAHGVDEGWWSDWANGKVAGFGSSWTGEVSKEISGSSALKRLPNMSTCESCHAKGVSNYNYTGCISYNSRMPEIQHTAIDHTSKITAYNGPQTCTACHPNAMDQVLNSVHFTLKTDVKHIDGVTTQEGMGTRYCGLPGSIVKINWLGLVGQNKDQASGCARCHIGSLTSFAQLGTVDQTVKDGIDCLVCHADKYDFTKRTVKKNADGTFVMTQDRSLVAAQSVGSTPKPANCQSCHDKNGGGYLYKRGVDYSKSDVHAQRGVYCVDCHTTTGHKIPAGKVADLWSNDAPDVDVSCSKCHNDKPHSNDKLNEHTSKINCTTCHIPYTGGANSKDFTKPVLDPITLVFNPFTDISPTQYPSVRPMYLWFNGTASQYVAPNGNKLNGKITPYHKFTGTFPVDMVSGAPIALKLGVYFSTGDLNAAVTQGVPIQGTYSGSWQPASMSGYIQVSHGVAPASQSITCNNCHSTNSVLDFKALGYTDGEIAILQQPQK